jgi:succinyl-CoA synthetase beta subunit
MFESYGVPVLQGLIADTPEEAAQAAAKIGGTVVVKVDTERQAGRQACRHAGMQACRHAGMQACRHAGMHAGR